MVDSTVSVLRRNLPFLKKTVYLDSASVSPAPSFVLRKVALYHRQFPFNYGVGVFGEAEHCKAEVDKARGSIARLIGARPEEVVFTKNTTEAINVVSSGLAFGPDDEIVVTDLEHQSNLIPWFRLGREAGVKVKVVKANHEGLIDPPRVGGALGPRTKLVAITHVSNVLGTVQRVEEIGRLVKKSKAVFMVDGAQSVGRIPVDVAKINCDFFAGCGRKALMGPQGTGFLFGKRDMLERLRPLILGSRAADVVSSSGYQLKPVPLRFEAGVINTSGFIGLGAATEYFQKVGFSKIQTRLRKLTSLLLEGLKGIEGIKIYGSQSLHGQAGIVSWNLDRYESHEVAKSLGEMGILVASGAQGSPLAMKTLGIKGVVRTSVHYYNTERELGRFLDCLKSMKCKGGSNDSRG